MIKPEKIFGENKVRDAQILMLSLYENKKQSEIAQLTGLSQQRVGIILYNNRALLVEYGMDKDYEKYKRVSYYKRMADKAKEVEHDPEYWMDKIKNEIEGPASTAQETPDWLNGRLTSVN